MISENIRFYRKRAGLTQADLGKILGVGKSNISMYETGDRTPPLDIIKKMAEIFGVDINTLTGYVLPPTEELVILSDGEKVMLDLFRSAGPYQQAIIIKMIEAALSTKPQG